MFSQQQTISFEKGQLKIRNYKLNNAFILQKLSELHKTTKILRLQKCSLDDPAYIKSICQYAWKQLKQIAIMNCQANQHGIRQFVLGLMVKIEKILINGGQIPNVDCVGFYVKGSLKKLTINNIFIGDKGCILLNQGEWPILTELSLNDNFIGNEGLRRISMGKWIKLQSISINRNQIGDKGVKYLSQTNWKHLKIISLTNNRISLNQSIENIVYACWQDLEKIYLSSNLLNFQSVLCFMKGRWKKIKNIGLKENKIAEFWKNNVRMVINLIQNNNFQKIN